MSSVLVLNIDYVPLEVISWRDAIEKIVSGKMELVEAYTGQFIRSTTVQYPSPAVVRLVTGYARRKVRMSRKNILARDAYTCQYCGAQPRKSSGAPRLEDLTLDHVVPRAHSRHGWVTSIEGERVRVTSWENVLTSCSPCNHAKADRTPAQAGLTPRKRARAPSVLDLAWMSMGSLSVYRAPSEWQGYLPDSGPWSGYWDVDLESD